MSRRADRVSPVFPAILRAVKGWGFVPVLAWAMGWGGGCSDDEAATLDAEDVLEESDAADRDEDTPGDGAQDPVDDRRDEEVTEPDVSPDASEPDADAEDLPDEGTEPEGFFLQIPEGTQLCTMLNRGDPLENLPLVGRLTWRSGEHTLPFDETETDVDWLTQVEIGPSAIVGTPTGLGHLSLTVEGTAENGLYRYRFEQGFTVGEREYRIRADFPFQMTFGEPQSPGIVLDEETLTTDASLSVLGGWLDEDLLTLYNTCQYTLFQPITVELDIEGGDELDLDIRAINPPCDGMCAGGVAWGAVVGAAYQHGGDTVVQDDFFHLGFTAFHHFGGQSYLVLFEAPIEGVAGLWVPRDEMGSEGSDVYYLDEALEVLETATITERLETWE